MLVGQARADVVVIVSARSPAITLTADQVADIFLGRAATFPGGVQAIPVDQAEGSAVRDEFYRKSSGKAAAQMQAYWARMLFTGRGRPPVEMGGSVEVRRQVAENQHVIRYIDRSALDDSVRPVLILR